MVLEFRTKDGNLFTLVKGELALHQYQLFSNSRYFKKETKTFTDKGSFTCLVCVECIKLNITDEFEIWLDAKDYIKIIP